MIEPHVEHGGASSWFWIAAYSVLFGAAFGSPEATGIAPPEP